MIVRRCAQRLGALTRAGALVASLGAALFSSGCSKTDQSLVLVPGDRVAAKDIDADPLRVLPTGAIMMLHLDAQALFRTSLGPQVALLASNLVPVGREAGFDARRDLKRVYAAFYAMQGADFSAVLQGSFNAEALRRAGDTRAQTPSGMPLVKSSYAGSDLYTVGNVGFAVLTDGTLLAGNETGMRRALDRLRHRDLGGALPTWVSESLAGAQAPLAIVGDVSSQAVVAASSDQLPLLTGLQVLRVLGNFQPPGVNLVGTLSYLDGSAAAEGAKAMQQLQQSSSPMAVLTGLGAMKAPEIEVKQAEADVQFAAKMDTTPLTVLLSVAIQATNPNRGSSWSL